jgi:hypothetical protein
MHPWFGHLRFYQRADPHDGGKREQVGTTGWLHDAFYRDFAVPAEFPTITASNPAYNYWTSNSRLGECGVGHEVDKCDAFNAGIARVNGALADADIWHRNISGVKGTYSA